MLSLLLAASLVAQPAFSTPQETDPLPVGFVRPSGMDRPWAYWLWKNGHVDEKTITDDLEAMAKLGFGGILFSDSMGYWDDENHLVIPARELEVMSPRWRELFHYALRECARLGLKFTMNAATSGGKLNGPWQVGPDAPKRLMCRVYAPGERFETPDFPYWRDVMSIPVSEEAKALVVRGWFEAGDGARSQEAHVRNKTSVKSWIRLPASASKNYVLRFGYTTIPGHDTDVDVLDPAAIERHFNRFCGALMDEAGKDLVGLDKTFAGIYSVSWEGVVPSWSPTFESDFLRFAGYGLKSYLPILAGLVPDGLDPDRFMTDYRRVRNDMFRENCYGTLAKLAHARGVMMYSENGGPWRRDPELFKEADQLDFLRLNDMPQGEFWVNEKGDSDFMFAPDDKVDRFHTRGVASAAHIYGKRYASAESFTHMRRHWTMSPMLLRIPIDKCFADGINHVVWHTFTCSPDSYGIPGIEYFAGTHINRNVTWHDEAKAFVDYLARCEYLLHQGDPVIDLPIRMGKTPYSDWGRYRECAPDGQEIPAGYNYDMVNDSEWNKSKVVDGWRVLESGMKYPAVRPALPDLEGPFAFMHRRTATDDIYFVQGKAKGRAIFRTAGVPRIFDAVTGKVRAVASEALADGRTAVELDLTDTGSTFVVFTKGIRASIDAPAAARETVVPGPWNVFFAYHRLTHTRHLPKPRVLTTLTDWTTSEDPDLRYFGGTATYTTTVACAAADAGACEIRLPPLPSGVAHVYVNGQDAGVVWCAPWTVPAEIKPGANEITIKYTNNWVNRLIGDCFLPEAERVTRSNMQLLAGDRLKADGKTLNVYSGYCQTDALQPSGLIGEIKVVKR